MKVSLIATVALALTAGAAIAGYQGFPSQDQLNRCVDAWNQPWEGGWGAKCLAMRANCEQRGGTFEIKLTAGANALLHAGGAYRTEFHPWCSKGWPK